MNIVWGLTFGCILAAVAVLILLFIWAHKHDGLVCGIRVCPKQEPRCVKRAVRRFSYYSDLESSVVVNIGVQSTPSEVWSLQSQSHVNPYSGCPGVFQASSSIHVEPSQQTSPTLVHSGPRHLTNGEGDAAEAVSQRQSLVESADLPHAATHEEPPPNGEIMLHIGQASGDEFQRSTIRAPFVPYPQCYTPVPNPWADEADSPHPTSHNPGRASVAKFEEKRIPLQKLPHLTEPTQSTRQLGRVSTRLTSRRLHSRPITPYHNHEEDEMWAVAYALPRNNAKLPRNSIRRSIATKPLGSKGSTVMATSGSRTRPLRKPKGPRDRSLTSGEQRRAARKDVFEWECRTWPSQYA